MRDAVRECAVGVFEVSGPASVVTGARCELAVDGGVEFDSHGAMRCTSSGPIPRPVSRSSLRRAGMYYGGPRVVELDTIASSWPGPSAYRPGATRACWASCCISAGRSDPARPWAGVSPMQHASDTGSLSGWLERRLSEEASAPVGSFLPVAKYEPGPGVDLDDPDADDPLGQLRADIGNAKGSTLAGRKSDVACGFSRKPRRAVIIKPRDSARILQPAILSS